ncbi:unnamed protein product [Cladocopium goreaui]|uniref:ATP-dependent DNA helicase n=1 Tax=Cladocopium goreaui TaxID=2562237 RepID=A0A9P1CPW2_9DINO|nr:unnamed protein product [Cladocopium goreaui]
MREPVPAARHLGSAGRFKKMGPALALRIPRPSVSLLELEAELEALYRYTMAPHNGMTNTDRTGGSDEDSRSGAAHREAAEMVREVLSAGTDECIIKIRARSRRLVYVVSVQASTVLEEELGRLGEVKKLDSEDQKEQVAHDAEFKKAKEGQMSKAAKMTEAHGQMLNTLLQMRGSGQTLEGAAASAATSRDRTELPPTVPDQREGAANDNDKKLLGKPIDEAGAAKSTKTHAERKHCDPKKVGVAAAKKTAPKVAKKPKQVSTQRGKHQFHSSAARKVDVAVPLRRVRRKTSPGSLKEGAMSGGMAAEDMGTKPTEDDDGDIYLLRLWKPSQGNQDPRAVYDAVRQEVATLLSDKPTLPEHCWRAVNPLKAYDLPDFHCAFRTCRYECLTQKELAEHITNQHADALQSLSTHWRPQVSEPKATLQAYHEILTWRCQQLAPIANCSIDRRCLRRLRLNLRGKQVGAAICFICARRYPFVQDFPNQEIRWQRAFDQDTGQFFGQSAEDLEKMLGFHTYHARYVSTLPADTQMNLQPELEQWTCNMSCPSYTIRVVACPEDKTCYRRCSRESVCTCCEVPICFSCWKYVYRQRSKPPAALSNDMLLGHPPREIYAEECTVLELLCASPCLTALTCFSIEWRYLQDRSLAQDAFMNRHRLCAKGNATTFPLPWEDLLSEFHRLDNNLASNTTACLPHVGKALSDKIAVIIKIGDKKDKAAMRQHIIHQAIVRRRVVVRLIATMVARSHPAYKGIDMTLVEARAEMLPENDVPAEIIALLDNDGSLNHVLRQKAATPVNDQMSEEQASCEFGRLLKPNAVVLEKTTAGCHDLNAQHVSALEEIVTRSLPASAQPLPEVTLYTGTKLLDQFQPLYFALAFPFVFPYGIGLPDVPQWSQRKRLRRHPDDPHVELNTWVKVMARRIEAQVSRDWVCGFTSWNLLFRSALNLSRTTDAYSRSFYDEETQEWVQPTGKHVEQAAQQLLVALKGSYIDVTGQPRPVKGDVSKLKYVQGLKPMARKLLTNMRHTAQGLPGTQEARKRMRFEIQAMRIRYGVPLFVTYTPDEAHQLLFVRMTRVQASDPVRAASVAQDFPAGDMFFPDLGKTSAGTPGPFEYEFTLPMSWAERREVLARDPLAAVDGFRALTHLMLKHLFGVRICPFCPDCNRFPGLEPCQDLRGSNAETSGGIFGRVDAVYISLEAQKSTGGQHGHMQVFVQCLHQHTSLADIFKLSASRLDALRREYEAYNAHVCHASYAGQSSAGMEARIVDAEASWPSHEHDTTMTALPDYVLRRAAAADDLEAEATEWQKQYLENDVVQLQLLKQHHYHPYNEVTQARVPLAGCQKSDRPGLCKSDFPRTQWLCSETTVLCPCKLQLHGMPVGGRKNRLGALHGPCGHEWLNGCAPAMLAGLRGVNCDVQVPYRLPYACPTCGDTLTTQERHEISRAAQRAQDAQTGYCADYCSKSQPMGHGEIKEFQKGHEQLYAQHGWKCLDDVGKRHANRFLSDAYLKGVVRGQVECCNLRAHHREHAVVAAERIATTTFESFPGAAFAEFVAMYHSEAASASATKRTTTKWTRRQASGVRHLGAVDIVQVYGHRPAASEVWWLSPYEFVAEWAVTLARVPTTQREWNHEEKSSWDVTLTPAGIQEMQRQTDPDKKIQLQPERDYQLTVPWTPNRIGLQETTATKQLRHRCYLQRRIRPCCPHFENSPVPLQKESPREANARLTITYFRAWTLQASMASGNVPFVGRLKAAEATWVDALRMWLTHLPCEETKRYVGNFLSVYRVRPSGAEDANSDDSGVDEPLLVTPTTLPTALQTSFRRTGQQRASRTTDLPKDADTRLLASYEEAAARAVTTWQHYSRCVANDTTSNPFAAHDPKAIRRGLKALEGKRNNANVKMTQAAAEGINEMKISLSKMRTTCSCGSRRASAWEVAKGSFFKALSRVALMWEIRSTYLKYSFPGECSSKDARALINECRAGTLMLLTAAAGSPNDHHQRTIDFPLVSGRSQRGSGCQVILLSESFSAFKEMPTRQLQLLQRSESEMGELANLSSRGLSLANQAELPGPGNAWDDQTQGVEVESSHVIRALRAALQGHFEDGLTGQSRSSRGLSLANQAELPGPGNAWDDQTQGVEVESSHVIRALRAALQGHFEDGLTGHSRSSRGLSLANQAELPGPGNAWDDQTQGVEVESSHVIRALHAALQGHFEDGLTGHSRQLTRPDMVRDEARMEAHCEGVQRVECAQQWQEVQAIAQNAETLRLLARKRRKLMRKLEEREQHLEQNLGILSHVYLRQADVDLQLHQVMEDLRKAFAAQREATSQEAQFDDVLKRIA